MPRVTETYFLSKKKPQENLRVIHKLRHSQYGHFQSLSPVLSYFLYGGFVNYVEIVKFPWIISRECVVICVGGRGESTILLRTMYQVWENKLRRGKGCQKLVKRCYVIYGRCLSGLSRYSACTWNLCMHKVTFQRNRQMWRQIYLVCFTCLLLCEEQCAELGHYEKRRGLIPRNTFLNKTQ